MINRINLKDMFLVRNQGGTHWHLCSEFTEHSAGSFRPYVIRELNEFEDQFINAAIATTAKEAWVWAGGNPQIPATLDELRFALETLDQIAEEADDSNNPLLVFAKEILIGAYKPEELTSAAMKAIEQFRKTK